MCGNIAHIYSSHIMTQMNILDHELLWNLFIKRKADVRRISTCPEHTDQYKVWNDV